MGRIFFLALLAILIYFSARTIFKPIQRPKKQPDFRKRPSGPDTEMAQDPECGVYVEPKQAPRFEDKGAVYYFCSENCRENFRKKIESGETK